uniref:Uncharacterized protein n=1 Tax=Physcomitrium patens TaxID=3218 RepID=A0A2K1KCZ6_PHYPA|nr:hypothetical protein PHYPA_010828 [Physcomitrium patens]
MSIDKSTIVNSLFRFFLSGGLKANAAVARGGLMPYCWRYGRTAAKLLCHSRLFL